jgi:CPA2 family monovalent cation:H+ antiporter-2
MLSDPFVIYFVVSALVALTFGLLMTVLKMPVFSGYVLAGAILGPFGLGFFTDLEIINQLGSIGVILLLFFIGVEISPNQLLATWRIALAGTILQVLFSVGIVSLVGVIFDWPLSRIVLIGFVISLSCTAVVMDYIKQRGEEQSLVSQKILSILIMQDMLVVPMLVILGLLGGDGVDRNTLIRQLVGGVLVIGVLIWEIRTEKISMKIIDSVKGHPEMQVFFALLLCFTFALITGYLQLSTALGAFLAGMLVGRIQDGEWISENLVSIGVIFVALFFASVGALIDLGFLFANWLPIMLLVLSILLVNTIINAGILRILGLSNWESVYGAALMAHVGEFSFVLAAIGLNSGIVQSFAYQYTIVVIALTILIGPIWVNLVRYCFDRFKNPQNLA